MKRCFLAGTGTEVGKTFVTSGIARQLRSRGDRVGVYKPVASDCTTAGPSALDSTQDGDELVSADAVELWTAAGKPRSLADVCPQRFRLPLAPDEAARREGRSVDESLLVSGANEWEDHCETLLIEGAGGLFSPISDNLLNIDLFIKLQPADLILVAHNRLGVIHDVLATLNAAASQNVRPIALYLNEIRQDATSAPALQADSSVTSNAAQISRWWPEIEIIPVGHGCLQPPVASGI